MNNIYICIIVLYIYNTLYIIMDTYVLYECLCFSKVIRFGGLEKPFIC